MISGRGKFAPAYSSAVPEMLNFDEFRAISARERNKESSTIKGDDNKENSSSKLSQDASTKADDSSSGINAGQTSSGGNSTLLNIEEFLELMQTQFLIVAMLLSDTFASFAMLYLGKTDMKEEKL